MAAIGKDGRTQNGSPGAPAGPSRTTGNPIIGTTETWEGTSEMPIRGPPTNGITGDETFIGTIETILVVAPMNSGLTIEIIGMTLVVETRIGITTGITEITGETNVTTLEMCETTIEGTTGRIPLGLITGIIIDRMTELIGTIEGPVEGPIPERTGMIQEHGTIIGGTSVPGGPPQLVSGIGRPAMPLEDRWIHIPILTRIIPTLVESPFEVEIPGETRTMMGSVAQRGATSGLPNFLKDPFEESIVMFLKAWYDFDSCFGSSKGALFARFSAYPRICPQPQTRSWP